MESVHLSLLLGEAATTWFEQWASEHSGRTNVRGHGDDLIPGVVSRLCRLATGPFGVAAEADLLLVRIAHAAPHVFPQFVRRDAMGVKIIDSLERAATGDLADNEFEDTLRQILHTPPAGAMLFRAVWLRGLRRVLTSDAERGRDRRGWVFDQLRIALRRERAYEWISESERRYAFWILAEFEEPSSWRELEDEWRLDPLFVLLGPALDDARRQQGSGRIRGAGRPAAGWPVPSGARALLEQTLDRARAERSRPGRTTEWKDWATQPEVRVRTLDLLEEGLATPSADRLRLVMKTLAAAGPGPARACTKRAEELLVLADDPECEIIVERALYIMGYLRSEAAVKTIGKFLEAPPAGVSRPLLATAVAAAANLASRRSSQTAGLVGIVESIANERASDELITGSIYTRAVAGFPPIGDRHAGATNASVSRMSDWATDMSTLRVLGDRAAPR